MGGSGPACPGGPAAVPAGSRLCLYQVRAQGGGQVLVAEHDLAGPLLDLVTAILAMGEPG